MSSAVAFVVVALKPLKLEDSSMTFRHGKDAPFPQMVRIQRMLKGAPQQLVDGIIKATPAAERAMNKKIEKANRAFRRKHKKE